MDSAQPLLTQPFDRAALKAKAAALAANGVFIGTDEITIKNFTNLPRFGLRAGKPNENFLNADLFASAFLAPCEPFRKNVGLLMFEFSHFYPADFARGRDFAG